jgi:excisionase family DNA binding protein
MERLLTPEDVARLCSVETATVLEWLRTGKLKGSKPGGKCWRVAPQEVRDFLARSLHNAERAS